jgi:hypothetical protein
MIAATARNSLWQFWKDSNQNCDVRTYCQVPTACPPCSGCSSLYAPAPVRACSQNESRMQELRLPVLEHGLAE